MIYVIVVAAWLGAAGLVALLSCALARWSANRELEGLRRESVARVRVITARW